MDRRRALRLDSTLQLIAVLLVVVFGNIVASKHFGRLDLTADRVHTLSQAGRVLMARLDRPLVVKVYFTKGLEAPYNNHEQMLVDKLEEFRAWSGGRMELSVVDPTGDKELEGEAQRLGITPIQYSFKNQNRAELRQVYMGAAFLYGDRQMSMAAITQVGTLEYDVARTIKALIDAKDRKTLGVLTGHGEPDLIQGKGPLEVLRTNLGASYDLQAVQLGGEAGVPAAVDGLLVIGPIEEVGQREQYQIDQFLMSGKPVAFFLSQFRPDMRTLRAQPIEHGLDALVGNFGIELNRDLVVDRKSNGKMNFPVRQGNQIVTLPINFPLIPLVTDLAKDSVVVRDLDAMTFPFVSSIDLPETPPQGVTFDVLARSNAGSGRVKGVRLIDPRSVSTKDPSEETGAFPVLVVARGAFPSFYKGKRIPGAIPEDEANPRIDESEPTRVVVAGSADFIANNLAFMQNLVDWMLEDEALIGIRSKTVQVPTLESMEGSRIMQVKAGVLLSPVVLLLGVGLVRRRRRA